MKSLYFEVKFAEDLLFSNKNYFIIKNQTFKFHILVCIRRINYKKYVITNKFEIYKNSKSMCLLGMTERQ